MPRGRRRRGRSRRGRSRGSRSRATEKKVALDPDEVKKVFRQFIREYQHVCQGFGVRPFDGITKPLQRRIRSENDPEHARFDLCVSGQRCTLPALRSLLTTLDHYVTSARIKAQTFPKTYDNLSLLRTDLSSESIAHLSEWLTRNNHLLTLELFDSGPGVAPRGCSLLGESLRTNETLTTLKLDNHPTLGDEGMVLLADGLQWNTHLKVLSARYCEIGEHGGRCLGEMILVNCFALTTLDLQGNPLGATGIRFIADHVEHAKNLESLVLSDTSFGTDRGAIQALCDCLTTAPPALQTIDLDLNSIGQESAEMLYSIIVEAKVKVKVILYPFQNIDPDLFRNIVEAIQSNQDEEKRAARNSRRRRGRRGRRSSSSSSSHQQQSRNATPAIPPLTGSGRSSSPGLDLTIGSLASTSTSTSTTGSSSTIIPPLPTGLTGANDLTTASGMAQLMDQMPEAAARISARGEGGVAVELGGSSNGVFGGGDVIGEVPAQSIDVVVE